MEKLKRFLRGEETVTVGEATAPRETTGFKLRTAAQKEMYERITTGLIEKQKESFPELRRGLTRLGKNLVGFSPEKKKARAKAVKSLAKFPIGVREALLGHLWFHPELEVRIAARSVLDSLPEDSGVRRAIIERDMVMAEIEDEIWERRFDEEKEE